MCVVSMVGDYYKDRWIDPNWQPTSIPPWQQPTQQPFPPYNPEAFKDKTIQDLLNNRPVSRFEFDALKKEVEVMKGLLAKAKIYDEKNNEPDCEIENKMKLLKEIAKLVGIDLDDVLKKTTK